MSVWVKIGFIISLCGTLGSLYFSEVMHFPPCVLCWYQRIFLYPLVFIFGIAIWTEDQAYRKYAFPLALVGLFISIYHNLIYYDFISEGLTPCTEGLSCSAKQLELFGFITIPMLSMVGFFLLTAAIAMELKSSKKKPS